MTYLEAINAIQQRGIEALKVAQSTQLASLRASRDIAVAAAQTPALKSPLVSAVSELATSFTFAVLEQQVAYAKQLADSLVTNPSPAGPPDGGLRADAAAAAKLAATATQPIASAAAPQTPLVVEAAIPAQHTEPLGQAAIGAQHTEPAGEAAIGAQATQAVREAAIPADRTQPVAGGSACGHDLLNSPAVPANVSEFAGADSASRHASLRSTRVDPSIPGETADVERAAAEPPSAALAPEFAAAPSEPASLQADPVQASAPASEAAQAEAVETRTIAGETHPIAADAQQTAVEAQPVAITPLPGDSANALRPPLPKPAATAAALERSQDEILSKTLPAPKAPAISASQGKVPKAATVSNKRAPKSGPGKK